MTVENLQKGRRFLLDILSKNMTAKSKNGSEDQANDTLKYILFWNEAYGEKTYGWSHGREQFIKSGCEEDRCYATDNRGLNVVSFGNLILQSKTSSVKWPNRFAIFYLLLLSICINCMLFSF